MLKDIQQFLNTSYTSYHAVGNVVNYLNNLGFVQLLEGVNWDLKPNSSYYVVRDGSSVIAFKTGNNTNNTFNIVACHTDSPCLKLKHKAVMYTEGYAKLNVETYGGGLYYTMLDRPLKIAGRLIVKQGETLKAIPVVSDYYVTIPSVAIHQHRDANDKLALNPQIDLLPLIGLGDDKNPVDLIKTLAEDNEVIDYDLYVVAATQAYRFGVNGEFIAAPRLDDLAGVFCGINSLSASNPDSIAVCACFDNEEVGSSTKQGAGSTFLKDVLHTICYCLKGDKLAYKQAIANSFMVSLDNAHAVHPCHGEKSDITNRCKINGGVVIKHHANQSYMTDGLSSAVLKQILKNNGIPYQDFYNRSDERSGSTLGTISNRQVSVRTVDVGIAQLAMHSFCESMGMADVDTMQKALKVFFNSQIKTLAYDQITVK